MIYCRDECIILILFLFFRYRKKPFTPAREIIIITDPVIILKVTGSEKTVTPKIIAKIILDEETSDPGAALIYLYPMVINNWPIKEITAMNKIYNKNLPDGMIKDAAASVPLMRVPIPMR